MEFAAAVGKTGVSAALAYVRQRHAFVPHTAAGNHDQVRDRVNGGASVVRQFPPTRSERVIYHAFP